MACALFQEGHCNRNMSKVTCSSEWGGLLANAMCGYIFHQQPSNIALADTCGI